MCNMITVPPRTPGYLQTVDRALRVLGAFSADTTSWGVSELARFLRLDKSGVQRSLATLALRGFLVADPVTRRYHLRPALIGLGRLAEESDATLAQLRGLLAPLPSAPARAWSTTCWTPTGTAAPPLSTARGRCATPPPSVIFTQVTAAPVGTPSLRSWPSRGCARCSARRSSGTARAPRPPSASCSPSTRRCAAPGSPR